MPLIFSGITTKGSFDMVYTLPPKIYDLWSWGRNSYGLLGLGDTTNRSSPNQIGSLTPWLRISAGYNHSLAIKTDGTMWSWGMNPWGQLGLGNLTYRSSPVQVGALTTWLTIASGSYHSMAIKTDGTMWGLGGRNSNGQLGLGNTTNYSSPKQVGALTNWLNIASGSYHNMAIKTDGTMWAWGNSSSGRLGIGNSATVYVSSPVQVGALTTWSTVDAGGQHTMAISD